MSRIRAVAIVIEDRRLLVVHRIDNGDEYYTLPGGGVEPNEAVEAAVIREVLEEASLKVKVIREVYQHWYDDGTHQRFFNCEYISGEPRLSDSAPERNDKPANLHQPMWLNINELPATLLYPLEIRDWIVHDVHHGFAAEIKVARLNTAELRRVS